MLRAGILGGRSGGRTGPLSARCGVREPAVRLFDWPARIDGVERTLEFIALSIRACGAIRYEAVEYAITPGADAAFVRVQFDWTRGAERLRSTYVVIYRYRNGRIARQELYYDPSGVLERLAAG